MLKYIIVIEKADGNYSSYCPDLPGCLATGASVEETTERIKEAGKLLKINLIDHIIIGNGRYYSFREEQKL